MRILTIEGNILSDCQYENESFGFKCKRESLESGFCEFHDEKYYQEHPKEISEEFHKLVDETIRNHESLICIGYNIVDSTNDNLIFVRVKRGSKFFISL